MLPIAWSRRRRSALERRARPARSTSISLPLSSRPAGEPAADAVEGLRQVQASQPQRQLAALGLGDRQQVLGELGEPVGLLGGRGQRRPQLLGRAALGERQLQLGPQDRQRRAQLVAGVGDEGALVLQRLAEALEHLVQRRAEPSDLVVGRRHRQALVGLGGGDLRRPRPHRLDRLAAPRRRPRRRRARRAAGRPARRPAAAARGR